MKAITGGPGGSGVQYLVAMEDYFRARVGPGYDIVGFDPRGAFVMCAHSYIGSLG